MVRRKSGKSLCLHDEKGRDVLMLKRTDEDMSAGCTRGWRRGTWGVSLLCSVGLFLGGCVVTKSTYDAAVADMETTRMELEAVKMKLKESQKQHAAFKQENEKLRADHEKAALDLEMLSAEIQMVRENYENERDRLAIREVELQKEHEARARKLQEIRRVYQRLKSQNRALRDTVRRYQKELKEARESKAESAVRVPAIIQPKGNASSATSPMAAKKFSPRSASPRVGVPSNGTVTPVNINTASANDLMLFLGLTRETADKVVSHRPYRLRGELVSKQVLPKATFDVIKDRITAAPR